MRWTFIRCLSCVFLSCLGTVAFSQTFVRGVITDNSTEETLIGASIIIKDHTPVVGTISNIEGQFELKTPLDPPFMLKVELLGYQSKEVSVIQENSELIIQLEEDATQNGNIGVISSPTVDEVLIASKKRESKAGAPVSVQNIGLVELQSTPNPDFYTGLANQPGVSLYYSGLTLAVLNTRGFGDVANRRFVQFIDGMDTNLPGPSFSLGNAIGSTELDIRYIELMPGAGSALYGPNLFNGALAMYSKNPFDYEGFSAYVKGGVTSQESVGSNPFLDVGLRYARKFSERFAVKVNLAYLNATDWAANSETYRIGPDNFVQREELLALPRNAPNFDALNIYGDELQIPVDTSGTGRFMNINRTGLPESALYDYEIDNLKLSMAMHYRINRTTELIYDGRLAVFDGFQRTASFYPTLNSLYHLHKLELNNENFYIRTYYSRQGQGTSYDITTAANFIQESLKPSDIWAQDYGKAFRGEVQGIAGDDHAAARSYADRDVAEIESNLFQQSRESTINNTDFSTGGSGISDQSSFYHIEGNYSLPSIADVLDILVGGSYRRYRLNSNGSLFNDNAEVFDGFIPFTEYGMYIQASQNVFEDRLNVRASIRYDKNKNFQGRFTPRAAAVWTLGEDRNHHIRISGQTGFRNPSPIESYAARDGSPSLYLGGVEENIDNYEFIYRGGQGSVTGREIFENSVGVASLQEFRETGDVSVLVPNPLDPLLQEKLSSLEIGYQALLLDDRLATDINVYSNRYEDFIGIETVYNLQADKVFTVAQNIDVPVSSLGMGFNIDYTTDKGYHLGGNYTFNRFRTEGVVTQNPGILPGFNTPNHMFNLYVFNQKAFGDLGFSVKYKWSDSYIWETFFGIGEVEAFGVVDAAVTYHVKPMKSVIKLGASNLFNNSYRSVYGGPFIGGQYFLGVTFDDFLY